MIQRYRMAFLLSLLVFISLWAIYLNLPEPKKSTKEREEQVIKIALLSPAIPKKNMPQKSVPKKIDVKKIEVKKVKVTKVMPKKIIKKKVTQKKIIKSVKSKKKIPRKRVPKKVVKKRSITKTPIVQQTTPITPSISTVDKASEKLKVEVPVVKATSSPQKKAKNNQYRKAFLRNVRSSIIANKKYPKLAKRRHIEGAVKVRFDITKNGEVTNIRFINGKRIFQKSIRKTLENTFPITIPNRVKDELPINDVSVILHFNII